MQVSPPAHGIGNPDHRKCCGHSQAGVKKGYFGLRILIKKEGKQERLATTQSHRASLLHATWCCCFFVHSKPDGRHMAIEYRKGKQ